MACCGKKSNNIIKNISNVIVSGTIGVGKAILHIDRTADDVIKQRLDKCRVCPNATRNNDKKYEINGGLTNFSFCTKCNCNILMKTKVNEQKCPIGTW